MDLSSFATLQINLCTRSVEILCVCICMCIKPFKLPVVLQRPYGPPGSILSPSSLKNRFTALKPSAFEKELNFKKSRVIFGDLG